MSPNDPVSLLSAILETIENEIIPLTREGVASGSKVFGAAILSPTTLQPFTVSTNNERVSPLLHGEINCIQKFFTETFPKSQDRPSTADCLFLATHEPCSLCLSGITWSGFKQIYYLFTYEDSKDLFSIPYDIEILEEVFRVRASGESDEELKGRALYNRENKFFQARSLDDLVAQVQDSDKREHWSREVERIKGLYTALSDVYQENKARGVETSSAWK